MKRITTNRKDIESQCEKVSYSEGLKIIKELNTTCGFSVGIGGLAHNQIKGNKMVFVALLGKPQQWRGFINPKIISKSEEIFMHEESCMSFPKKKNQKIKVPRHIWITIRHETESGYLTENFNWNDAFVIQHEIDHLNGIHIVNKAK